MLNRSGMIRQNRKITEACILILYYNVIISYKYKISVKFFFLTQILYPQCYNKSTKERSDLIGFIKKSLASNRAAYRRSRNAVLRSLARRGGYRTEQGDQTVSGVCGNWIKRNLLIIKNPTVTKKPYHNFYHAFDSLYKRRQLF